MTQLWKLRILGFVARQLGVPIQVHHSFFTNGSKEKIV